MGQCPRWRCFLSFFLLLLDLQTVGVSTRLELLETEGTSWLPSASITPMTPMSSSSWKLAMRAATAGPTFQVREEKSTKRWTQCAYTTDATVSLRRGTRGEPPVTTPS